jgi:hypothetical protein
MRWPDLEADLAAAVPQVEKTPEPLWGAAGSAAETASALHRVDKQLVAAQEDDPWGTDPAVQDQPAVQAKRRRCAARRCHWSGDAGPACWCRGGAVLLKFGCGFVRPIFFLVTSYCTRKCSPIIA